MLARSAARVAPAVRNLTAGYTKKPLVVTITGAAGNIGYALAPRILNGEMLGADQPVILKMLELPQAQDALEGCKMELDDCAFPLAHDIVCTSDPDVAFEGCDYALLVGAAPRGPGMERADLLQMNAKGFKDQGQALDRVANKTCKVIVTGNPANTNCLVAASWAKTIPATNFSALTRLDHNRGLAQLSAKFDVPQDKISKFAIWGNHSPTMYPDTALTNFDGALLSPEAEWLSKDFIPDVQQRGAAIIKARGKSSAMSAASATIDHARDLHLGSSVEGAWNSMAVLSNGEYGFDGSIYTSFPVLTPGNGEYSIIADVPVSEVAAEAFKATNDELVAERDAVTSFMP